MSTQNSIENSKRRDISFETESVLPFIRTMVKSMIFRYHPKCQDAPEDVAWDTYVHFVEKNLFGKYDENVTSKAYLVKMSVRNYLIDLERKASRKIQTISGDREIGDGLTIFHTVSDTVDSLEFDQDVDNILALLKGVKEWGYLRNTPELGDVKIGYYQVMVHHVKGYDTKELAEIFEVSISRINAIIKEATQVLKTMVSREEILYA